MSSDATNRRTGSSRRTVPQLLALIIGALFLLAGIAGFFVTGFDGWLEHKPDQTLVGFGVNPLHNVVHLVIGITGIALAAKDRSARVYGWLLVLGYGVTLAYGLFVAGQEEGNLLNINWADNGLHAASIVGGLVTAAWPRAHRPAPDVR